MKELRIKIADLLINNTQITGYTGNHIYHHSLPANHDNNNISIVYLANASGSESTFDKSSYSDQVILDIKINHLNNTLQMYELGGIVRDLITSYIDSNFGHIEYNDDELIYNPDLNFYTLNLRFTITYDY